MTDEELIARLRELASYENRIGVMQDFYCGDQMEAAADRIEALVNERDQWIEHTKNAVWADSEELKLANARAERLEAALREIESISVHSGGEVHGVTALQWELAFAHAQDIASAALK